MYTVTFLRYTLVHKGCIRVTLLGVKNAYQVFQNNVTRAFYHSRFQLTEYSEGTFEKTIIYFFPYFYSLCSLRSCVHHLTFHPYSHHLRFDSYTHHLTFHLSLQ